MLFSTLPGRQGKPWRGGDSALSALSPPPPSQLGKPGQLVTPSRPGQPEDSFCLLIGAMRCVQSQCRAGPPCRDCDKTAGWGTASSPHWPRTKPDPIAGRCFVIMPHASGTELGSQKTQFFIVISPAWGSGTHTTGRHTCGSSNGFLKRRQHQFPRQYQYRY